MANAFDSNTWEAEAVKSLRGLLGLQSEFQDNQGYRENPVSTPPPHTHTHYLNKKTNILERDKKIYL